MASTPTDAFFFYVGDFKLLGTLVPLMTRRVCTSVGGTLRLPGMSTHPPPCRVWVPVVLVAGLCSLWVRAQHPSSQNTLLVIPFCRAHGCATLASSPCHSTHPGADELCAPWQMG